MSTFDGLFTKAASSSKPKASKKDPFAGVFAAKKAPNPVAASHPFNPLNPNSQANLDNITKGSSTSLFGNLGRAFKDQAKIALDLPKQLVDMYRKPSEMTRQAESAVPNVPVLHQVGQVVLRTLIPVAEGFGTIVGGDIIHQRELASQTAVAKPRITGKQVTSSVPEDLVTHKLTAEDVVNVAMASVNVGTLIAPFLFKLAGESSLKIADRISTNTKVPLSYSDLQKITTSTSDLEAIQRVGQEKFDAYREATQKNTVRKAIKQGYVELAQKDPNKFANIIRNAATRPITEIRNFAKPYGKPVYVPNVGLLPERVTVAESKTLPPEVLKNYEPKVENGVVDYQLQPKLAEAPKPSVELPAAKPGEYPTIHDGGVIKMVKGEPVKIVDGVDTFIHPGDGGWVVSEASTGRYLADGRTKESAIAKAKFNVDNAGMEKFIGLIRDNQLKPPAKSAFNDLVAQSVPATPAPEVAAKIEGNTPSKIGQSIQTKAIEQGLTQGFEGVAGYDKITIKDQAARAVKQLENLQETRQILSGEKPLPEGLKGTALITAVEEQIKKTGDGLLAYELANSPLVSETSSAAQELRLAAERQPDSVTAQLKKVQDARAAKAKAGRPKVKAEIKREVAKSAPKAKDWASFLEEIKCK